MITHYGLFWSAADVYWGQRGPRGGGELLGKVGAKGKREDFRQYIGIYALYVKRKLLYVGQAGIGGKKTTLFSRLRTHHNEIRLGKWDEFSWFGREESGGKAELGQSLAQLEAVTIAISNPRFNMQSGSFEPARRVSQVPHSGADGDVVTKKLDQLQTKLDRLQKTIGDLRSNS